MNFPLWQWPGGHPAARPGGRLILPRPVAFVLADGDDVALETTAVKLFYRLSNAVFRFHFDQRDPPALIGISASDDRHRSHLPCRGKMVVQFSLAGFVG